MGNNNTLVLTFESHYFAIKAKRLLGTDFRLAPTPRLISSTCSSCLMRDSTNCDTIYKEKYTQLQGIEGVYLTDYSKKEIIYEK